MFWKYCCLGLLLFALNSLSAQPTNIQKAVLSVERIWDRAGHNAFTDLTFFRNKWYCTFREGTGHIPGINGSIRVIASEDGENWYSVALLSELGIDLRDPKLSITPDNRLMLNIEAAYYEGRTCKKRESWVTFSDKKGKEFNALQKITLPAAIISQSDWIWRVTWHEGTGYGVIYQSKDGEWDLRLLRTTDGLAYDLVTTYELTGRPSEVTLRFNDQDQMIAMARRDGDDKIGMIGTSNPPYTSWTWKSLDARLGGPNFLELPDGRLVATTRDYTGPDPTTILAFMDTDGHFSPILTLPSKGDTSYPGMVIHNGELWVSYYSGHEGKVGIYLARLSVGGIQRID